MLYQILKTFGVIRLLNLLKLKKVVSIVVLLGTLTSCWPPAQSLVAVISLTDPVKLATLEKRGANPRVNKVVYWLNASDEWHVPSKYITYTALFINGTHGDHGKLTAEMILHNLKTARDLGLLTEKNQKKLKNGKAATITRGPYEGETVEIDHVIPVSIAPEIGNDFANLEMLPSSLNRSKSDQVGERQLTYAKKLLDAGVLSEDSYQKLHYKALRQ